MSRRKIKKRRRKCPRNYDSHHILHYRRLWDYGFKSLLRRSFIYELPIEVHHDLHTVVGPVPPLEEAEARQLWYDLKAVDHDMDLYEGLEWLIDNAPNNKFAAAITAQYVFLQENLGRS